MQAKVNKPCTVSVDAMRSACVVAAAVRAICVKYAERQAGMSQAQAGHTVRSSTEVANRASKTRRTAKERRYHCIALHGMGQNDVAGSCVRK